MKKILALTLGSALIFNSSFAFSDFSESHWAYKNVLEMQDRGIISGFEDNTFRPNSPLTRAQFITMAVKGLELDMFISSSTYSDVDENYWAWQYIQLSNGALDSTPSITEFRPEEVVLREDVAMAIVKLNNLQDTEYSLTTLDKFVDSNSISEDRKKYVAIAVEKGFMSGSNDGTFNPAKGLTRAEGATVVLNMLNKTNKEVVANWDGEYISNIDGLTKIKLTKISDTEVNFFIRGIKDDMFAGNDIATISGNTAKYVYDMFEDKGEINFTFDGTDLVVETTGYEHLACFNGRYKIDDGTISSIERVAEKNPFIGKYLLGEEIAQIEVETFEELEALLKTLPDSLTFEILDISETEATYTLGGVINKGLVARMGTLEKQGEKWVATDFEEQNIDLEIEFNNEIVLITGITDDTKELTGEYVKKQESPADEYIKLNETVDGIELTEGGWMF